MASRQDINKKRSLFLDNMIVYIENLHENYYNKFSKVTEYRSNTQKQFHFYI